MKLNIRSKKKNLMPGELKAKLITEKKKKIKQGAHGFRSARSQIVFTRV